MKFAIFTNVPNSIGRLAVKEEAEKRGHIIDYVSIKSSLIDTDTVNKLALQFEDYDVVHIAGGLGVYLAKAINTILEERGVFCVNSHNRVMEGIGNKVAQAINFVGNKIEIPKTCISFKSNFAELQGWLNLPFVAKDPRGTQGKAVWLIKEESDLSVLTPNKEYLFQEFIENDGDYRVHVLGEKYAFCSYKRENSNDFRSNISLGGLAKPIVNSEILNTIEALAVKAAAAMKLDYCGVDIICSRITGKYSVIETNSDPGFKYVEETTGQSFAVPIVDYYESVSLR